jgi:hypothetical protein
MAHNVELGEQNCRLRRVRLLRFAKRLPHIHRGEPEPPTVFLA